MVQVPNYQYKCSICSHIQEHIHNIDDRHNEKCDICGNEVEIMIGDSVAVHIFHAYWHEHLDRHPIYIESKKQLYEEAKKRNKTAYY